MIKVENLTKRFGSFTAVENISFHVKQGEVLALLGTNGAGKTTTLEIIEGLSAPTSGSVEMLGQKPGREVRKRVGIMLQKGGLPRELTVEQTARMWHGMRSNSRPYREVIAEVGLSHKLGTKVGSLSGGEQRRLDLACALMNRPPIIILDEPTTGLDPESRHNAWQLLRDYKAQGGTLLLTTHYLEEAESLADTVAIMHRGRIAIQGTLAEVLASQEGEITYQWADSGDLPEVPGAQLRIVNGHVTIKTRQLQEDTAKVLSWANGRVLPAFKSTPASLDQVFQHLS
ncbi:ABC transporter ATP-binding protein [Staphylococcus chromogenes]|nr:ABC transporter ATP-binding protein [Staphylococcus chromogenes]